MDEETDTIESEAEGIRSGADDGAGVGFADPSQKKTVRGLRAKRSSLKIQHLSKEDLERVSLECRVLSARKVLKKLGAEELVLMKKLTGSC